MGTSCSRRSIRGIDHPEDQAEGAAAAVLVLRITMDRITKEVVMDMPLRSRNTHRHRAIISIYPLSIGLCHNKGHILI